MDRTEIEVQDWVTGGLSSAIFWFEEAQRRTEPSEELEPRFRGPAKIVDRVSGLSIKLWADEHPPPHFHVSYQGQDASFSILDCRRLAGVKGLERYEATIRNWWSNNRLHLIRQWNALRPTNCPVGPIPVPEDDKEKVPASVLDQLEREIRRIKRQRPQSD